MSKGVIPKAEYDKAHERRCPKCNKVIKKGQGHFVPPSLGEEGFFGCEKAEIDLMAALKNSLKNIVENPNSQGEK